MLHTVGGFKAKAKFRAKFKGEGFNYLQTKWHKLPHDTKGLATTIHPSIHLPILQCPSAPSHIIYPHHFRKYITL